MDEPAATQNGVRAEAIEVTGFKPTPLLCGAINDFARMMLVRQLQESYGSSAPTIDDACFCSLAGFNPADAIAVPFSTNMRAISPARTH